MNTIKINRKQVHMVAHRGASGLERENTNAAFIAAGNRSYWGIEADVHKAANGQYVIIHDDTTFRVSGERCDLNVQEYPFSAFSGLTFPDLDSSFTRRDLRMPLLAEYIQICRKYEKTAVLELKTLFTREELLEIIQIIQNFYYLPHVVFIAFDINNCINIRQLLPEQRIQWLCGDSITEEDLRLLCRYNLDLDIEYHHLSRKLVGALHSSGLQVNCWTCNDPAEAESLIDIGVDFITTNILE